MENVLNNPYLGAAATALTAINLLLLAVLAWRFFKYRKRQAELLRGEEIPDMEEIVLKHKKTLATHNQNLKELGKILEELVENNKFNVQKIGFVRFNPFADAGGNISFALALLDGYDNGIVISSLHGREGTRMYAKDLALGVSKFPFTDEEKQAIKKAQNN